MEMDDYGRVPVEHMLRSDQPPTLRDQFAMAALTGLIPVWQDVGEDNETAVSTKAYAIADAMLIVRLR